MLFTARSRHGFLNFTPTMIISCWSALSVRTKSGNHNKGTKDDDIEETGEPAERLLDPIFKVGANNKPQCSFKLEVKFIVLIG